MNKGSNCIVCGKKLSGKQTMFCCERCKNKVHQSYDAQKKRGIERKLFFVDLLGGECEFCGYKENLTGLSFHHKSGKEFSLDVRSLSNRKAEYIIKEILQCQLLCHNCHSRIHNPKLDLANLSIEPTALTTELRALILKYNPDYSKNSLQNQRKKTIEPDPKKKFLKTLRACGIKDGQALVLAVSGGVDSVTMLDLFAKTNPKLDLIVAHLNHGVREEAVDDEMFVAGLANKYGLKFEAKTIEKPKTGNLEEVLREERRKFLLETAEKHQADFVALAHNANDQAETVIFNLLRGAGPAGLAGMNMKKDQIFRPLLSFSREEIEKYAKENELKWHEDITNKDISYSRNYLRHEILPKFSKINDDWLKTINRASSLQKMVDEHLKKAAKSVIKHDSAKVNELQNLDLPVRYEVYGLMFEKLKGNRKDLTWANLSEIEKLLGDSQGTKAVDLPNEITAIRNYDTLAFSQKKAHNMALPEINKLVLGKNRFGKWLIQAQRTTKLSQNSVKTIALAEADLNKVHIRTWQNGDRIAKLGLPGKKKLQDLFTDAKIDKESRRTWPVLVKDHEIIWVPEIAVSRELKQTDKENVKLTAERDK